jgi:hypothetical protein
LKAPHGVPRFLSEVAVEGKPMARTAQGSLYVIDIRTRERRPLQPDLSNQRGGLLHSPKRPVRCRAYDAIDRETMGFLEPPDGRVSIGSINAIYPEGKMIASQESLQLGDTSSLAVRTFEL